ncbi:hypothetical protein Cadr_000018790 [Camelus dromedarius]|uniref:Uncharacterized protein n=1 Tax=Camelus dromedarius TaxID=9838 RepID=A0A5N4D551_CAMDR|nr:hypothetical protein Cadr_000018790 [Camelus dromedarius]
MLKSKVRPEDFFQRMRPLWLRDMYRPLSATRKKFGQKLHDGDLLTRRDFQAPTDDAADVVLTSEPDEPDEESETVWGTPV